MKHSSIIAIVLFIVIAFVGCNEIEKLKVHFIADKSYVGLGAYREGMFYTAVQATNDENFIFVTKWDASIGMDTLYFIDVVDDSLGGKKYVKGKKIEIPVGWDDEKGILVRRSPWFLSWEEMPKQEWTEEVKEIISILLEEPKGVIEAQIPLAIDLGYMGETI